MTDNNIIENLWEVYHEKLFLCGVDLEKKSTKSALYK